MDSATQMMFGRHRGSLHGNPGTPAHTRHFLSEAPVLSGHSPISIPGHLVIFWKDSQVELSQELFTTFSVLHTTVVALFHLSVIWEICLIHSTFQMRK